MINQQTITKHDWQNYLPSKPDFRAYMENERAKIEQDAKGKITIFEAFAGIGAPRMACERVSSFFITLDIVEIWKDAVMSYNLLYGTNYDTKDIREWFWKWNIRFDCVFHGSPCQDLSMAGKKLGAEKGSGTRSSLLFEMENIIANKLPLRPKVVIWENVKGALAGKNKAIFEQYIEGLSALGYLTQYKILNAKEYGIPQNRNRVFVVSVLKEFADEFADFAFSSLLPKPTQKLVKYLERNVDLKYFIKTSAPSMMRAVEKGKIKIIGDIVDTITTKQFRWNSAGVSKVAIDTKDFSNFITIPNAQGELVNGAYNRVWKTDKFVGTLNGTVQPKIPVAISASIPITGYITQDKFHNIDGVVPTVGGGKALRPNVAIPIKTKIDITGFHTHDLIYSTEGIAPTIGVQPSLRPKIAVPITTNTGITGYETLDRFHRTDGIAPTVGGERSLIPRIAVLIKMGVNDQGEYFVNEPIPGCAIVMIDDKPYHLRTLTPRECWRLMDFQDQDYDKVAFMSDNNLYKMAGNSIVVAVLEQLFQHLFAQMIEQKRS